MNKKKFLLLTSFTVPDTAGSGINAYNLLKALNESGHLAQILSFKRSRKKSPPNVIRIPYLSGSRLKNLISSPFVLIAYLRYIPKTDVLFIYGSRIIGWEIAVLIARLFGVRVVFRSLLLGVDDVKTLCTGSYLKRKARLWVFKQVNCYYAINKKLAQHWLSFIGNKDMLFEAPQGIDTKKFCPEMDEKVRLALREKLLPNSIATNYLSIGFLIKRKGYKMVFETLAKLSNQFAYNVIGQKEFDRNHFLVNYNNEAQELLALGENLLKNKINFVGYKTNANEYLRCSDVFIHGPAQELPNVVFEAMASGVPVVASGVADVTDTYLKHNTNCLIYNSEKELLIALERLECEVGLTEKLTANALKFIQDKASFNVTIEKLNSFIFRS